jgi:hypothetical protein
LAAAPLAICLGAAAFALFIGYVLSECSGVTQKIQLTEVNYFFFLAAFFLVAFFLVAFLAFFFAAMFNSSIVCSGLND